MKKQYQLREGEALHEWIDRLMESLHLRRLRGLTQEQLAQEAGLQRTHVNRIEAGKYAVTIDVVQAIAQVLGMTVDLIDPALQDLAPLRKLNTDK